MTILLCGAAALAATARGETKPDPLSDLGVYVADADANFLCFDPRLDGSANWDWNPGKSPLSRPLIRDCDRSAVARPNAIAFTCHNVDCGLGKVLFTCDGGGFGMIDVGCGYSMHLEAFGRVEGRPVAITQLGDTVFVLAVPDRDRITLVDCSVHPWKSENQPKKHFVQKGICGVDWDQPRHRLWAIGPDGLVGWEYAIWTTKDLVRREEHPLPAELGAKPRDLRLNNDGLLSFVTDRGVCSFDADTGRFALVERREGLFAFGKSTKGNMYFTRGADGTADFVEIGGKRVSAKGGAKLTAAAMRPVGVRDFRDRK